MTKLKTEDILQRKYYVYDRGLIHLKGTYYAQFCDGYALTISNILRKQVNNYLSTEICRIIKNKSLASQNCISNLRQ